MYVQLVPTSSDTEIAVLGVAWVDNLIKDVLMSRLVGNRKIKKKLIAHYAHSRKLAHCLGILGLEEYQDIEALSDIRNRFAHDLPTPTFEDEHIGQVCEKLSTYGKGSNREVFERAVYKVATALTAAFYES